MVNTNLKSILSANFQIIFILPGFLLRNPTLGYCGKPRIGDDDGGKSGVDVVDMVVTEKLVRG